MNTERIRHLMKAHVKGHTRVVNGKVVYIHDYDAEHNPQGRMAHLHERTAVGKHKNGTHYLRATDAEDGKIIQEHADKLGIKVSKRRSGANHFGRTGAYDHYHMDSPEDAVRLHEALKDHHMKPHAEPGTIAKLKEKDEKERAASRDAARVRNGIKPKEDAGTRNPAADAKEAAEAASNHPDIKEHDSASKPLNEEELKKAMVAHRNAAGAHMDASDVQGNDRGHHSKMADMHFQDASEIEGMLEERTKAKKNSDEKEHYSGGDKIRYTGKTEMLHGGKFHEFEYLDGHKKGQKGVNAHGPDGLPGKPPEKPSGIVTPQIAPLGSGSGQPPAAPPKVETIPEAKDQRDILHKGMARKPNSWDEAKRESDPVNGSDHEVEALKHLHDVHGVHKVGSGTGKSHERLGMPKHPNAPADSERPVEHIVQDPQGRHFYVNTEGADYARYARYIPDDVMAKVKGEDEPVTVRPSAEGKGYALPPKPDSYYDKTREAMAAGTVEAHEAAAKHYEGLGDKKQAEDHRLNAENIRKMAEANPRPKGLKAGIPFGHPSTKGMAELKSRQLSNQRVSRMHMGAKENFGSNGASKEAHEASKRAYKEGTAEAHKAASDAHFKATQGHEIAENRAFGKGDTSGWKGHSRMRDHHTAAYGLHDNEARKIEAAAKTPEPAKESKHDPAKAKDLAARASRVMEESRRTRELSHGTTHIQHAVNAHQATTNATAASHEAQANGNHRKAADLHLEASNAHFKAAEHARLKGSAGSEEEHLDNAANHKAIAGEHRSMA